MIGFVNQDVLVSSWYKGKCVTVQGMSACVDRGITPSIRNLETRWRRVLILTLRPVYPRRNNLVTLLYIHIV